MTEITHTGLMTDSTIVDPRDPRGLRADAPLLDAWLRFTRLAEAGLLTPMTVPGHKQRHDLVGAVVTGDAPLYGGLDSIKHADALRIEAERRAAQLWGGDWCRFSVAGSTHGNQALALAVGSPGQEVIITRTLHRSLLLGLVLAGLHPVWVRPEVDPASGLPAAVAVDTVQAALAAHPRACAVFLGDPSYVGAIGDLAGHAAAAHDAGVPLIVDAAWAAHLGFHPDLPPHAIAAGADAMVTSAHKALPAYTQGALVVARTERLDAARLDRAFEATHTTSPAGSIMASIDASRALLARDGGQLCARLLRGVAAARQRLRQVAGVSVLDGPGVDPAKLVVLLAGTGAHGYAVENELIAAGMPVELADRDTIVPIVTVADDESHVAAFTGALAAAIERHRGPPRHPVAAAAWTVTPQQVLGPREAFFAQTETVAAEAAVGRVSAELVAPYPPGVPVLAPGELVTRAALDALREVRADGGRIAYAADPTLGTFQVVIP
ncbi:MAG TPA: DegT/DnrJ/EryC1/StrS family aminotransferase [Streptosporangiaceae bacterium]|nr:DegT/DnrJ/EryC1/StrS family aminotransferase [Streptosporangiaceae bacterium]